jgi:hypothetical protein
MLGRAGEDAGTSCGCDSYKKEVRGETGQTLGILGKVRGLRGCLLVVNGYEETEGRRRRGEEKRRGAGSYGRVGRR